MKTTVIQPHKSSFGVDANIISMVIFIAMGIIFWLPFGYGGYLGWGAWVAWIVPLVFFFLEKESKFIKFQAGTALVIGVIGAILYGVVRIIASILTPSYKNVTIFNYESVWRRAEAALGFLRATTFIGIAVVLLAAYLAFMAFSYKQVELPLIGAIARKASGKLEKVNININQQTDSTQVNQTVAEETVIENKPVFCGECGAKNESGKKFCGSCGKPLA
ncbi:MAG: hypothetical protein FWG36_00665 [Oscillospiraceae bacterium]|nr:hypothetical protein [Oscillospiraceae bacterium]